MYFILEVEVAEIRTTLCLCNESTDRKVNTCRRQLKKNQGGKNILIVMPSGFCYKWTCWTFSWCQKRGCNLVLFMFHLYLLTLLFQCFHNKHKNPWTASNFSIHFSTVITVSHQAKNPVRPFLWNKSLFLSKLSNFLFFFYSVFSKIFSHYLFSEVCFITSILYCIIFFRRPSTHSRPLCSGAVWRGYLCVWLTFPYSTILPHARRGNHFPVCFSFWPTPHQNEAKGRVADRPLNALRCWPFKITFHVFQRGARASELWPVIWLLLQDTKSHRLGKSDLI